MTNLAMAYQTGTGVPADPAEARHWRDLAAAHPVKPAMAAETASPAPVDLLSATNGRP
jgi:TPR repeat protein